MGEQATRVITGQARRRRFLTVAAAAAVVVIAASAAAVIAVRGHQRDPGRPAALGHPGSVPDATINLMGLAPVPARPAPGFTLTDQAAHRSRSRACTARSWY